MARRLISGVNDLLTTHPAIAEEWNKEKNGDLQPSDVFAGSSAIVWWKCRNGHEWEDKVADRKAGRNCPYCGGRRLIVGYNDFASIHPDIAKEWNYLKNGTLKPSEVTVSSNRIVWWICDRGHEWKTAVYNRHRGKGCSICKREYKTSFPEQSVFFYIKKYYPDAINGDISALDGAELDIYIPSIHTAIEYDGYNWHNSKASENRDKKKCIACKEHGITIIRIRDEGLSELDNCINLFCKEGIDASLELCTKRVLEILGIIDCDVNIQRDRTKIYSDFILCIKNDSLEKQCPELSAEWNFEKNGTLNPNNVTAKSGKSVWWKCIYGHEWQATIASRSSGNHGCPYCSGRRAICGQNDLATVYPELAAEWHPTKNGKLATSDVSAKSHRKIWWLMPYDDPKSGKHFDFEWESPISYRNPDGSDCPFFNSKQVWPGYNDLKSQFPDIAAEWHPTKNRDLSPNTVSAKSGKKVWWICKNGHEWEQSIDSRSCKKLNCPICSGNRVLVGYNDLATKKPQLAKEWHATKNEQLKPTDVTQGSNKKVWWKCAYGHEWQAVISSRSSGTGCPYCSGNFVVIGVNDLATTNPELAAEWHPTKNGELQPTNVKKFSGKKVWWKCKKGHEWEAKIARRSKGAECPYCRGSNTSI